MKYIQTLTEKGKLKWHNSDAPEADGKFRDLSPKDLAAWLIKTRKGDMKRISGSLSQQVAFNQNDDKEYVKKMDKTRIEVYKQMDREDLLESVDMDDLKTAKEYLSNPHTILDITYDKTRRGDKFVRFDYENKYVPGKMLDSGPHFVKVFYDNTRDLKKISKELNMDLKESVLNEEDTWNDYPAAAKKNAQKAIDWKEEHGRDEVDAGTPVGWARAHQLAKGENLSTDTVKRMSAFNRHRKNSSIKPELKETPWKDRGYVAWLIWGGDEGVDWAIEKSKEIDAMKESNQLKYIKPLNEAEKYITDEFKVGDKIKTNFGEWEVIETDYAPNKSFIAPFIFKGKDMERVNIPNPPKTNKKAVGYKVTDGDKYPIIGFLYQYKDITKLATVGVDESVNEAKAYKLKASEFGADTHSAAYNVKGEPTWRVHSTYAIDQVSGGNNPEERDVVFFEAMPINNDLYIKIGGINNLKRTNGATVGNNFGTTVEEWKKDPKGIAKEASEFLTDADHLKWINKKARSEGQKIKWALKDDYSSVIEDLVNKALGLSESVDEARSSKEKFEEESGYFQEMINDPKKRVYDIVDFAQFTTGGMTEKQWEMFMYGRYKKHLQSRDAKIKEKMYDVLTKWLTESVNEEKIKYVKGKTYQSSGHWTVVVDSNSSGLDIRVNHSAGWRLDPHDEKEETFELLDNGRQRATLYFKSGNIDKFAKQMFDLNDRTTHGNATKLTAKDYGDILRVWIDMRMANEAKLSTVHRAAKKGSYPAVIVVVQDGKVIHQEPVSTPDVAPATFNVMQEKYPKALLHLEDKTGKRLFSEAVVTEGKLKISGPAYDLWDDRDVQRKLKGVKIKIVGDIGGVMTISGADDEIQKVKDILGLNESVVTEGMSNESKFSPLGYAKRVISGEISLKAAMKEAGISFSNISKLIKQIDKSFDLDAAIAENRKYIKTLNEGYWSHYDYEKWTKENGKPKYPKWVKVTLKEIVKGGFMESHYDAEHNYMVLWLASLETKRRSEMYAYDKKGIKEFGKVGYAMYQRFYNDLTSYNMFFMQGAMYALEVSKHIQDRIANGEAVEPAYYMMKEYFNGFGMKTDRSRVFNAAYEKLEKWMKDNQIKTL